MALAVYARLYAISDLGMPLEEILRLAGLSTGQWTARINIDFPAQEGTSNSMARVERWHEQYTQFKKMPRADLRQVCTIYLENMRIRKELPAAGPSTEQDQR